jgi:hypothetical protein
MKCPLGVHHAATLPTWRFQFLVFRNVLSPTGEPSLLASVFVRMELATKGRPVSTRLHLAPCQAHDPKDQACTAHLAF